MQEAIKKLRALADRLENKCPRGILNQDEKDLAFLYFGRELHALLDEIERHTFDSVEFGGDLCKCGRDIRDSVHRRAEGEVNDGT